MGDVRIDVGTLTLIAMVGLPCITGLIWLIRLEGRVNLVESRFADLRVDLAEIKNDLKQLVRHRRKEDPECT